jgi:hypothetical protein
MPLRQRQEIQKVLRIQVILRSCAEGALECGSLLPPLSLRSSKAADLGAERQAKLPHSKRFASWNF